MQEKSNEPNYAQTDVVVDWIGRRLLFTDQPCGGQGPFLADDHPDPEAVGLLVVDGQRGR
jgi:hypothetical protein